MTTAGGALVAGRLERPREPGLMVEPDAHEEIGGPEARDLSGLEIERVRVLKRWGEALDADPVTAHHLDERLQIGGRRHHVDGATGGHGAGGCERDDECEDPEERYDFLLKADFGIMQCTPLRTSTTWLTRQSPIIDVSEYAS